MLLKKGETYCNSDKNGPGIRFGTLFLIVNAHMFMTIHRKQYAQSTSELKVHWNRDFGKQVDLYALSKVQTTSV